VRDPATIGWGLRSRDRLCGYISQWFAQCILSRAIAGGAHDMALFRISGDLRGRGIAWGR
jgi:hypothetical protein